MSEGKLGNDNLRTVSERTAGSMLEQAMIGAALLTWTAIERPRTVQDGEHLIYRSINCLLV